MPENSKVYINGPLHPDLFGNDTPIVEEVNLEDLNVKVYRVECTYYIKETQTHFVVAESAAEAENEAWELVQEEDSGMNDADTTEMSLDAHLNKWSSTIMQEPKTARDLLLEYIKKNDVR